MPIRRAIRLIDCHAHIFTTDLPIARDAWIRPDYSFTAEDLIASARPPRDRVRGDLALSITGYYNDYMISQLRLHSRLRGTGDRSAGYRSLSRSSG